MREKYDGYKSTFGNVPEPPKSGGKGQFLCLTVVCVLLAGLCFGTVAASILAKHRAAQIAAAQQLAASQAAAVQRVMTVFPNPEVKSKVSNIYRVAGFGITAYNADTTYVSATQYNLSAGHYLIYADPNFGTDNRWLLCTSTAPSVAEVDYMGGSDASDPTNGAYTQQGTDPIIGTVTLVVVDTTAPVIDTATGVSISKIGSDYKLSIPFTEAGTVSGTNGFSLAGLVHGAVTFSAPNITSNVLTYTLNRVIYSDETAIKLNYAPGDFADNSGNNLAAISNVAVNNNSTQEYVAMPITFTITTNAQKALAVPTTSDPDVTIDQTQAGSDGTLTIPARVPMLNKNFSVRQAATIGALDAATGLNKAMMTNFDLSALVNPIWFFDENEETFQSHVDGEAPVKKLGLRVSKSSSDLPALKTQAGTQPATPKWYQLRGVHADTADYTFKAEFFASPNAAITLGAGNNVRYVEFPLGTVISGLGYAARFRHTMPA